MGRQMFIVSSQKDPAEQSGCCPRHRTEHARWLSLYEEGPGWTVQRRGLCPEGPPGPQPGSWASPRAGHVAAVDGMNY